MTRKSRPSKCASPSRRSRVTPGRSSTSASFLPTSLLNSVDLPTLGRPIIAKTGSIFAYLPPFICCSSSTISGQIAVIVKNIEHIVRHYRREGHAAIQFLLRLNRSIRRIDIDEIALRRNQNESPPGKYRSSPVHRILLFLGILIMLELADPANFSRGAGDAEQLRRSEEHTSELQSLMRISYAVFCLKKKNKNKH